MYTGSQIAGWMKRGLGFAAVLLAYLILAKPVEVWAATDTSITFRNGQNEYTLTDQKNPYFDSEVSLPKEGNTKYYKLFFSSETSATSESDADLKIRLENYIYKIDILRDISLSYNSNNTSKLSTINISNRVNPPNGCKNFEINLNGHRLEAKNSGPGSAMFLKTDPDNYSARCTITGDGELILINDSSNDSSNATEGLLISGVKLYIITGNLKIDVCQTNSSAIRLNDSANGGFLLGNSAGMDLRSTGTNGKILTKELGSFSVHGVDKDEKINTTNPYIVSAFNSLDITPESPTILRGSTLDFTANLGGWNIDSTNVPITWELEGASNPNTTLSASGQLSVSGDESADTLTVKATATYAGTTRTGTAMVKVTNKPEEVTEEVTKEESNPQKETPQLQSVLPMGSVFATVIGIDGKESSMNLKVLNPVTRDCENQKTYATWYAVKQYGKNATVTMLLSYDIYAPYGADTLLKRTERTLTIKNTGAKPGDIIYVEYYNQETKRHEVLPCTVNADGSVSFTIPMLGDVSTISIFRVEGSNK